MNETNLSNPFSQTRPAKSSHEILLEMEADLEEFESGVAEAKRVEENEKAQRLKKVQMRQKITEHIRDSHLAGMPTRHPDLDSSNTSKLRDIVTYIMDVKGAETEEEASSFFRNIVSQARDRNIAQSHPLVDQAWMVIRTGQIV